MKPASNSTLISGPDTGHEIKRRPPQTLLAESAQAWNLAPRLVAVICLAPLLVALSGVAAALLGEGVYQWLTGEDRFAENLQVLFWLLACGACFRIIRRLWRDEHRVIAFLYLCLNAGIFFIVGEELNWGQRIFGWATPESLKAVNRQHETNIHSLEGMVTVFRWLQLMIGAYGTILPLIFARPQALKRPPRLALGRAWISMLVPHYTLAPYFLAILAWRIYVSFWWPPAQYYYEISRYSEVIELILAAAFFLFMVFQLRKNKKYG